MVSRLDIFDVKVDCQRRRREQISDDRRVGISGHHNSALQQRCRPGLVIPAETIGIVREAAQQDDRIAVHVKARVAARTPEIHRDLPFESPGETVQPKRPLIPIRASIPMWVHDPRRAGRELPESAGSKPGIVVDLLDRSEVAALLEKRATNLVDRQFKKRRVPEKLVPIPVESVANVAFEVEEHPGHVEEAWWSTGLVELVAETVKFIKIMQRHI